MLVAGTFKLTTVGASAGGHVVQLQIGTKRYFALRLAGQAETADDILLTDFDQSGNNAPGAVVISTLGDSPCIDLGRAQVRIDERAIAAASSTDKQAPGHLIVHENGIAISAKHLTSRSLTHRSIDDGVVVVVGENAMHYERWSIGVQQPGEPFVALLEFSPPTASAKPKPAR